MSELEGRVKNVEEKLDSHIQLTAVAIREFKQEVAELNVTVKTELGKLIDVLAGVNKVDLSTFNLVIKIFGLVIIGFVLILGFILTGQMLNILPVAGA